MPLRTMSVTSGQYPVQPHQRRPLFGRGNLFFFLNSGSSDGAAVGTPGVSPSREQSGFQMLTKRSLFGVSHPPTHSSRTVAQMAPRSQAYTPQPHRSSGDCSTAEKASCPTGSAAVHQATNMGSVSAVAGPLGRMWGKLSSMSTMATSRGDSLLSTSSRTSVAVECSPRATQPPPNVADRESQILSQVRYDLLARNLSIDDFLFHETVGTGSFGRVCIVDLRGAAGWYPPMALKILSKHKIVKMKQVEHVKDEKRILSSIEHPFIVNLLAAFQDEKRLFILMEYVNGGELFSHLRRRNCIPTDQARLYAAEITLAFQYLHQRHIVYRDLKPENLLIDSQGHIKITDFGFAKVVKDRTWTLCGTHEYLAPESITRRGHGLPVDWWALGILLFEMLAGHPPFVDENPLGIYRKIIAGKIEFPRSFDYAAKSLVKRLLTHDPLKRYGCLKDGAEDVKNHKFFKGIDWVKCYNKNIRAPYLPNTRGPQDSSMFDKYAESTESSSPPIGAAEQQAFFDNF
ncbi:AGC kinase [Toxoplasma gondii TgCatPRC2]|uniref:AGC kinase n=16 Tax=Toxoplasma gondii TaxID=5811 RepID=B9PSC0_TOXGV|nr:AGC kinase [Toxoplasma gondii ME49]EPR59439.1 AGC kinase [Toxoplasma gondii GT1]ESS30695.1 AGC kinase [Toxoplasma gondii VEG]KAF4643816.1 AGC kinase [Toxoplasma gondii]KFG40145.1 AGC kinase [Toxoplasma gondii GAB2-2007-GAL-DOM2]KFG44723.1 AGC kinase [Toxoplasma gondii p89]KFG54827.1 AGC kinase [Toxoplasma gondii FOU]KFG63229.1 AGC kinase [Toxoplasma gondii RUB]KFH06381.1 AGC kinase [Toxoplasma gondii MAS]KFH08450.1 AGC kinase [Toxoplasma gondii VAND]KYF43774.1 AGC kinase [Toxoplasma go|eukprot:XP_002369273.1 AGC kinase [Toxoplasma gondii ME49]